MQIPEKSLRYIVTVLDVPRHWSVTIVNIV